VELIGLNLWYFLRVFNLLIIGYLRLLRSDKYKLGHGIITAYLYGSPIRGEFTNKAYVFFSHTRKSSSSPLRRGIYKAKKRKYNLN
jgi:hypothetical protein